MEMSHEKDLGDGRKKRGCLKAERLDVYVAHLCHSFIKHQGALCPLTSSPPLSMYSFPKQAWHVPTCRKGSSSPWLSTESSYEERSSFRALH